LIAGNQVVKLVEFSEDRALLDHAPAMIRKGKRAGQEGVRLKGASVDSLGPPFRDQTAGEPEWLTLWLVMAGEIAECTIRECGEEGRVLVVIGEEK
jgi:hypothetical protein